MPINFCTIASGSSGNSAFLSTDKIKILIDAGLSGKAIETALASRGVNCCDIDAIFITHEHSDHVQGAGVLSRRFDVPIYLTKGTWSYVEQYKNLGKIAEKNRLVAIPDMPITLEDVIITPFSVPHDANDPVGYTICTENCKIAIATDLGHVTDDVAHNFCDADVIMIESNHDIDMLKNGPYPPHLKRRILSDIGHLSNASCGVFLAEIFSLKTKHIFLAHLSQDNNHPALAFQTVKDILNAKKIDAGGAVGLYLADRNKPSAMLRM